VVRLRDKLPKKNGEGSWRRDAPKCSEKQMRTPRAAALYDFVPGRL
jgi:hypothetical protein